jgi:hypothetical protein
MERPSSPSASSSPKTWSITLTTETFYKKKSMSVRISFISLPRAVDQRQTRPVVCHCCFPLSLLLLVKTTWQACWDRRPTSLGSCILSVNFFFIFNLVQLSNVTQIFFLSCRYGQTGYHIFQNNFCNINASTVTVINQTTSEKSKPPFICRFIYGLKPKISGCTCDLDTKTIPKYWAILYCIVSFSGLLGVLFQGLVVWGD